MLEALDQLGVGLAVLLDRDAQAGDGEASVERAEQVSPGVGLGGLEVDSGPQFAERAERLGASDGDLAPVQGGDPVGPGVPGLDLLGEVAGADAGQEEDEVELAGDQAVGEGEGLGVVADRDSRSAGASMGWPPCLRTRSASGPAIRASKLATRRPSRPVGGGVAGLLLIGVAWLRGRSDRRQDPVHSIRRGSDLLARFVVDGTAALAPRGEAEGGRRSIGRVDQARGLRFMPRPCPPWAKPPGPR